MSFNNPLTSMWDRQETAFGIWCSIASSFGAEIAGSLGYDYACVDLQHGAIGYSDMVPMLQAISISDSVPITRVSWPEPWLIMQALDAGALGVVVPLVETPEQAAKAVAACRYPPEGDRSFGPTRASVAYETADPSHLQDVACIVMIETISALANLDEIAATPGLDALYVGPSDLAMALGLPPRPTGPIPEHEAAIEKIRLAAERHGLVSGIHCASGDAASRRAEQGFQMVTVGNDVGFLSSAMRDGLSQARQPTAQTATAAQI